MSTDLLPIVAALGVRDGGVPAESGVVVALSGGPDSVALLDVLVRLRDERRLRLIAAHLDHALRENSAEDAAFCQQLCDRWEVPLRVRRTDIARLARRDGESIEAAGRRVRYGWLRTVRESEGFDLIATGHQLDDHAETVLLWLFRGAGLSGLRGIAPQRGRVVRPLRSVHRSAILEYLRWRGLESRTDPSNASPQYLRNRVRNELLPVCATLFGANASTRLDRFSRVAGQELELLEQLAEHALDQCRVTVRASARPRDGSPVLALNRDILTAQHPALQARVLRLAVERLATAQPSARGAGAQRWTTTAIERLRRSAAKGRTGARTPLPGGGWLTCERARLVLTGPPRELGSAALANRPVAPGTLRSEVLAPQAAGPLHADDQSASFDADRVELPVSLRPLRAGDRMRPHGMRGQKRITRICQDRGVAASRRRDLWVVEDQRRIIWAVGLTTSDETRVTPDTRRILRLSIEPEGPAG